LGITLQQSHLQEERLAGAPSLFWEDSLQQQQRLGRFDFPLPHAQPWPHTDVGSTIVASMATMRQEAKMRIE
jgi:hypothetical protein